MKKMKKIILTTIIAFATMMSFAQTIQKGTDKKGNLCLEKDSKVIVNEKFDKVGTYSEEAGLIPAKLAGKWGFYDNDGKLVIPHQYDLLYCWNTTLLNDWYLQERIEIGLNGVKSFIDKTGKPASPREYETIVKTTYEGAGYFFKKGGKWALADKDKKVLTEFKYDKIMGPSGINPFVFVGVRGGQEYRLNAQGQEEAAIELPAAKSSSSSTEKSADKCMYKCQKCNKTTQGKCNSSNTGITVENCFAQQPVPKGPRKNHEWRKQ